MTILAALLLVWVVSWAVALQLRVRQLERDVTAWMLQVAAMFESVEACDDALADMIEESKQPADITLSMN